MTGLPIYKEHGIGPQQFGRIDYASLQGELRHSGRELEHALDRLSEWAYKKMEGQAKQAGAEWAAQNPITQEQLTTALNQADTDKRNANLAKLIRGDRDTVTGAAILDIQLGQVRSMLELDARREVTGIDALAQTGNMAPGDVLQKLNAVSSGYGEILARMGGVNGAKEAESLRASIAAISQPVFAAVSKRFIDQHNLATRAAVAEGINGAQTALRPLFEALVGAEPGEPAAAALANLITAQSALRKNLTTLAITSNDHAALGRIDSAISGANIAAITGHLGRTGDMARALSAVSTGQVGNLAPVLASMSDDDRKLLTDSIRAHYSDRAAAEKQAKESLKDEGRGLIAPLIAEYIKGGGVDNKMLEQISNLNLHYDVFPPEHIAAIGSAARSTVEPNYSGMLALMSDAVNGKIKPGDIVSVGARYGIPTKDAWTVFSQVVAADARLLRGDMAAAKDAGDAGGRTPKQQKQIEMAVLEEIQKRQEENRLLPPEKQKTQAELRKSATEFVLEKYAKSAYQKRVDALNDAFKEGRLNVTVDDDLASDYIDRTVKQYEITLIANGAKKHRASSLGAQLRAALIALKQQQRR